MRNPTRLWLALGLLLPLSAQAQQVSADAAKSLQQQLRAWIAGMAGPGIDPGALTLTVTAEDDHYRLALPIPSQADHYDASAQLRPLDNGRWSLQHIQVPATMHFNMPPSNFGGTATGPTALSVQIGAQNSHAVIDPALHSRSSVTVDLSKVVVRSHGAQQRSEQRIGHYDATASLQPNGAGRLDFHQSATITDWSSASSLAHGPAVAVGADRVTAKGRILGLDRAQAGVLFSAVSGLIATLPANARAHGGHVPLTPAERSAVHRLVEGLRGILTSLDGEEDIDGLHVAVAGLGQGNVRHVHLGLGGNAANGLLQAWLELALNGITVSDLPPEAAGLMPTHVELRPSVHGVPAEPLLKLALDATRPDTDPARLQSEAEALLAHGGVTVALDSIGFDVGPTAVHGTGQVLVTGPDDYAAQAHLTATGLDALIDKARTDPMLQQGIPILIMLRGFARHDGDHLVWNVVARGGGVTVNGVVLVKPHGPAPG